MTGPVSLAGDLLNGLGDLLAQVGRNDCGKGRQFSRTPRAMTPDIGREDPHFLDFAHLACNDSVEGWSGEGKPMVFLCY